MDAGMDLEDEVRDLVRGRAPLARGAAELPDELRLGSGGAGLDSITLVELLLDCARRFAVPAPVELLDGVPLTIGSLVAGVRAALRRARG
jgi:acyl carrier protein